MVVFGEDLFELFPNWSGYVFLLRRTKIFCFTFVHSLFQILRQFLLTSLG